MKKENKVLLVQVEDESVYNKVDWTAIFSFVVIAAMIAMFVIHVVVLAHA